MGKKYFKKDSGAYLGTTVNLNSIYRKLLKSYDPQGWWPIINSKTFVSAYHRNAPKNNQERFEICIGAILTQNTSWLQAEKALANLKKLDALNPEKLVRLDDRILGLALKPAGYFNQKAKKARIFAKFYISLKGRIPTRQELLSVWGVGKETADSMLLYGYKVPVFVVDTYTKRIFSRVGIIKGNASYDDVQKLFHDSIEKNPGIYNEYHALIVEHAKRHCKKKPLCNGCPLNKMCDYFKKASKQ